MWIERGVQSKDPNPHPWATPPQLRQFLTETHVQTGEKDTFKHMPREEYCVLDSIASEYCA